MAPIDIDYIPVDFDAYSIIADTPALQISDPAAPIDKSQKVWRISSLTAQVDDDTRILVLPVPESKRVTKISETRYSVLNYPDLLSRTANIEKLLAVDEGSQ